MDDILTRVGVNINVSFSFVFLSLIWIRLLAMGTMIPFLFGKPVPRYILVGASAVLAIFAYPALVPAVPPQLPDDIFFLIMLYIKEAFYGFAIGFAVSLLFHAFESVGQMIDNQRGLSIARILIPQLGEQGSVTGQFLFQLALVLYLTFGGHRVFFEGFFMSYRALPVLEFPTASAGMLSFIDLIARLSGEIFMISLTLAAPVIIAILVADIVLGIANRVAPQINVWELGFNIKGYLGILLLFVSLSMIGDRIYYYSQMANDAAAKTVWYLQGHAEPPAAATVRPEDGLPKPESGTPAVITK